MSQASHRLAAQSYQALQDARERIAELEGICAELYQVIGSLADHAGVFDHPDVARALDNASQQKVVHDDLLPWPKTPLHSTRQTEGMRMDELSASSRVEGCAEKRPEDYVREFMEALADKDIYLITDRVNALGFYDTTSWGFAGKAAILKALRKATP